MVAAISGTTRPSSTSGTSGTTPVAQVDVLVVEDDELTRVVIVEALEFAGYAARGAPDGAAALALAERLRPRLILLDLWMPVMDGWQFAAHYRNTDGPIAPIVLLSADPQLAEATEQLAAYGFIRKPFDLDFFREVVARAINAGARHHPLPTVPASDPSFVQAPSPRPSVGGLSRPNESRVPIPA
jgi:two-component system, chemotaxis family, chemotaxis protein CheY